jgi:hypothetical protein
MISSRHLGAETNPLGTHLVNVTTAWRGEAYRKMMRFTQHIALNARVIVTAGSSNSDVHR